MQNEFLDSWKPSLNWETPPGECLKKLLEILPKERNWNISVFGSAPLEMSFSHGFLSNDVDILARYQDMKEIEVLIDKNDLTPFKAKVGVQACIDGAFRTSPKWKDRTFNHEFENGILRFAHPMDILIGKIHRLDEKDLKAFNLVFSLTGEPSESTLKQELIETPDLFSFAHMDEFSPPFRKQVEKLWTRFYGKEIDVENEIVKEGISLLRKSFSADKDFKRELIEKSIRLQTKPLKNND